MGSEAGIPTTILTFAGFLLSLVVVVASFFKHVNATADKVRSDLQPKIDAFDPKIDAMRSAVAVKIDTLETQINASITALRTEIDLKIDRVSAVESRARHDQNNALTILVGKLEISIKDMARKEDFARVETALKELSAQTQRGPVLESQYTELCKRFDRLETFLMRTPATATAVPSSGC